MTTNQQERQEHRHALLEWLEPNDTVYTVLRHRSASGMTRWIDLLLIKQPDAEHIPWRPQIFDISWRAAKFMGYPVNTRNHDGIEIGGAGMDMGFELVYILGRSLWPEGFTCIGNHTCPANDHVNGDRDYSPHTHRDGGYALRQKWL